MVDVLLFGAHPDDVEWGAGGIALLLQQRGVSFGIVDLTEGELGSRGTPAERAIEAQRAADFVGAVFRENLSMPDTALVDSPESRRQIATAIRKHRPRLVLAPYWEDRHPDHAAAANGLGLVSLQKHDFSAARDHFEKAVQLDPDLAEAQMNLGLLYEMAGDRAKARTHFENFLAKASPAQYRDIIPKVKQELSSLQ